MKTRNAKTIAARAAAAGIASLMAGTTLVSGLAANLADLPAPFVEDGQADVLFVLGQNAAVQDLLGSIDIATALQANAVTEQVVNVPGSTTDYSISEGLEIGQAGDDLNYQEAFDLGSDFEFDKNDLPVRLADGQIKDQDENEEWDYDQEIRFINDTYPRVTFGIPDSDIDLPQVYVDFNDRNTPAYRIVVDFDESTNLATLDDSETIDIFGKAFTFDPSNTATGNDMTLFGSDVVTFLELNVPQTITSEGETYEVEVVGANSEGTVDTIILSVNGQRETVQEGQSRTIGGVEVFIQDVFVTNIPTLDASATIFVGSEEYKLDTDGSFNRVELNGDDLDASYFQLSATGNQINATSELRFEFRPVDLEDDSDEYLLVGESVFDPMFDIELVFAGPRPALNEDERSFVDIQRSGTEYEFSATNRDGDRYEGIPLLEEDPNNTNGIYYVRDGSGDTNRVVFEQTEPPFNGQLVEDDFFFTFEGSSTNPISRIFTVDDIDEEDNVERVTFIDLADGSEEELEEGDTLGSTGLVLDQIDSTNSRFNFTLASDSNIVNWFVTEGDLKIFFERPEFVNTSNTSDIATFGFHNSTADSGQVGINGTRDDAAATNQIPFNFTEDFNSRFNDENEVSASTWEIYFRGESSDEDIEIQATTLSETSGKDDYDDYRYALTAYGSYAVRESENDGDFYQVWYPDDGEADYVVFLAPRGATVSTSSASGGEIVTQVINQIPVDASRLDVDVDLATVSSNVIVVGGPRANSIAYELLGMPSDETIDELFPAPGTAWIKLFDLDSGKVAMLVAGYSAQDTQAASRAVATFDSRLTGDEVKLTVASLNSFQISSTE